MRYFKAIALNISVISSITKFGTVSNLLILISAAIFIAIRE